MADGLIYRSPLQQSTHMQGKYSIHDDQPQGYRGMTHSGDTFKRRPDYGSQCLSRREEGRRSSEHDGDKLKKIPYPTSRSDDRGRDPKRSRLEHRSRSRDRRSRERRSRSPERHRNYRARSSDRRRSLSPTRNPSNSHAQEHFSYSKSKNDEFRELETARRRKEQEERIIAEMLPPSQRELSNPTYGLSEHFDKSILGIQQSPNSGYVLHRPDEAPQMPKKSILKKRTEPGLEPSTTMQFDEYRGVGVKENPEHKKNYVPPESFSRLPQHESSFPETEQFTFMRDTREMHRVTEQGGNANFHFAKHGTKSETGISSEIKDRVTDFLLPHEQASQDGSGFSRILELLEGVENSNSKERRKRSFPDIEDEERFLYGEDEEEKTESAKLRPAPTNRNLLPVRQTSLPEGAFNLASMKPDKEYEKIHDLLKTIGLDIGVTEISKLAARTQERLHGKKPATRSPDRPLEPHKSSSWDKRRSRNETKSPEPHTQSQVKAYKQENIPGPAVKEGKESFRREATAKAQEPERAAPRCPAVVIPANRKPGLLPLPSPPYVMPPFGQFPIPPVNYLLNAPLPNYNQYDPYLSYPAPPWPTYPPPQVTEPYVQEPNSPIVVVMQQPKITRPNLRVIETVEAPKDIIDRKREDSVLVQVQKTSAFPHIPVATPNRMVLMPKSAEEEKRKSEQKQKVLEEKGKLLKEKEARQKRLEYLGNELQKLRKQQGELLRKKRREKDGHKDPLLVENGKLQEDIVRQMSLVRQQVEEAVKKLTELEKVAQILGVVIQDKSLKPSDKCKDDILEKVLLKEISTRKGSLEESDTKTQKQFENVPESGDVCEYYDAGNHWCKNCNTICGTLFDFFTHMHNKRHRQTLDPYDRPWSAKMPSEDKNDSVKRTDKITLPAKGSEFLMPVTGFYCQLCEKFYGDQICAEDHVKSHGHNDKYKEYLNENPVYEQRRNLDRQAGLVVIMETERRRQAGLKRKIDEEKRVQKQKRLEESDERKAKLIRMDMEERASVTELEEERSDRSSSRKMEPSSKPGIKLLLKKDEVEDKKDEEQGSSFGKFSWKKEEEKSSTVGAKEENGEGGKEKDDGKGQAGKSASKTIEIKLSGKTLIAHTSPWVPFTSVSTTTQAKIRPNLPVANMPLRKASGSSLNKPAPLDTFLSIRSSGASNKPLPVVKAGVLLAPEVISRAFGGEEVTLKGSILDVPREPDPLAEEPAPGVSECEQTILAVPVRPPPPPPPVSLSDSSKKTEKPKTCLAAANAKDLYGIYYSSSGKSPADRLGNSAQSAKLGHGALKSAAGQVKIGDGKPSEEPVHSENTVMVVPKQAVPNKSSETDEQAESGVIAAQEMRLCGDYDLSTSTAELQTKGDEMTVVQQASPAAKWMDSTAEQPEEGDSNLSIPNSSEKVEVNASVLQTTLEEQQQYDDISISSGFEAKDVKLHAPVLDSAEQSQQYISSTGEQVKDMETDAVVSDSSAEQPQQCDDLSISNALEVKDVEIVAPVLAGTAEQPQQCDRNVSILTAIEVGDVDGTPTLDSAVDDDLNISGLAEQVSDEVGVHPLDSTADHPLEQCDTVLSLPTPAQQIRDMEIDTHVLDNTADQPEQCDVGLSFSKPKDKIKDVEVDAPALDSTPEQCDSLSLSKPIDEVKDVEVDSPALLSTADCEECDIGLRFSEPIDEVKDIKVDVFISDNTAEQQDDVGFNIISPTNDVRVVEGNTPILDCTVEQQHFDALEQVRVEEMGGHKVDQIGCSKMSSSLQTDLCDNHVMSGPIPDQQEIVLTGSLQIKPCDTHVTEEQNADASSSQQAEQVGDSELIVPKPAEQCREMSSSQQTRQHDNSEVSLPDTEQDQEHGESSFPEPEDLSESGRTGISDQTRHSSGSQISTVTPEVQAADSVAKAIEQPPLLQNVSTSEMAQKESIKPSGSRSIEAADSSKVGTREEFKSSGSSRTSSRRAAQAGKSALCSQTSDKTTEKRESDDSANIQAPAKQPRRRSARNLRSAK
ncbi:zinc finger protein 318 [Heterodontus francisci]|uniref:zinc finger protein 318 n=1 Tax=Heterodontus francisci TaxID=7792 RepID=UPI00355B71E3